MNAALPVVYGGAGPVGVIEPITGEVLSLDVAPNVVLAAIAEELAYLAADLREARSVIDGELARRMAAIGERRLDIGSHMIELGSRREWDPDATWAALGALVAGGLVSATEAEQAMPEVTTRKPSGTKLNALLTRVVGVDPGAAQALAQARSERPYIKVARTAIDATPPQ